MSFVHDIDAVRAEALVLQHDKNKATEMKLVIRFSPLSDGIFVTVVVKHHYWSHYFIGCKQRLSPWTGS